MIYVWSIKYRQKKLIVQFVWKSRDERFEPSQSMIEYYLPNKKESAIIPKFQLSLQLNAASLSSNNRTMRLEKTQYYLLLD